MPTSRFWGYYEFLKRYYEKPQPVDKREAAIQKAKDLDWSSEIRKIKHD
jgi:type II secretory pathway component PulC